MDSVVHIVPTLPCTDQDRADKFYKNVLELKESDQKMPGGTVFEGPNGMKLFVYKTDVTRGENTALTFGVTDFNSVVSHLKSSGVEFDSVEGMPGETSEKGIYDMSGTKLAWFKDSEGNVLNVFSV